MKNGAETDSAAEATIMAFPFRSGQPPPRRARVLFHFPDFPGRAKRLLAAAVTSGHGKLLPDAAGEAQRGCEVAELATGISQLLNGEYTEDWARALRM